MRLIKTIILALLAVLSIQPVFAEYYYYEGKKVNLTLDKQKICIMTPKVNGNKTTIPGRLPSSVTVFKTLNDEDYDIKIFKSSLPDMPIISMNQLFSSVPGSMVLPCYLDENGRDLCSTNLISVCLKSTSDYYLLSNAIKNFSLKIEEHFDDMPLWYYLSFSADSKVNAVNLANMLYETGGFRSAAPVFWVDGLECSYDPDFPKQWGLYNSNFYDADISVCGAWGYATGRNIKIAIIDSGIELDNSDLQNNIFGIGYDASSEKNGSILYDSHGTHCAGVAAAKMNNNIAIAGVAPNARIIPISVNFHDKSAEIAIFRAIRWAWQNGADIISCSWKCDKSECIKNVLNEALAKGRNGKGCVVVKSAGNVDEKGDYSPSFPAGAINDLIVVSAIEQSGEWYDQSCYGDCVSVCAPGKNIWTTWTTDEEIPSNGVSGTSLACPFVSGIAALILEINPTLTQKKVKEIIEKNAVKGGSLPYSVNKTNGTWNSKHGYGLVNASKCVINTPY